MARLNLIAQVIACLPFNREAVSNAIKSGAIARYGKKPNFPQDEKEIDVLLNHLEELIPDPQGSKAKKYFEFLLKLLFGMNPPGFVLGEDDYKVKPLLTLYHKLSGNGALQGTAANLQDYVTLEDLEAACDKVNKEKKEKKRGFYTPEQEAIIKAGSQVIYSEGGWVVHMIPKGKDEKGLKAGLVLCDNDIHNVKWCVGRGTNYGNMYIPNGNFYVLEHDGHSEYAISSDDRSATIWNPADTPIFQTGGDSMGTFPRLEAIAKSKGIDANFADISSLPTLIVPVLPAVTKKDKYLAERIPEKLLVQGDTAAIAKVLHIAPIKDVVEDLNQNYTSRRSINAAAAIMAVAVDPKVNISFKEGFPLMTTETFIGFLEAYAAKVGKVLPADAEAFLLSEIEKLS